MLKILTSKHFLIAVGLLCAFWVSAQFIDTRIMLQIANGLMVAVLAAVAVAYAMRGR